MVSTLVYAVAFCATVLANGDIEPSKLVGTWQQKRAQPAKRAELEFLEPRIEFDKGGRVKIIIFDVISTGTYSVRGTRLTVAEKCDTETMVSNLRVLKLTDAELVLWGGVGVERYVRVQGR